jgi:hypothetical protein
MSEEHHCSGTNVMHFLFNLLRIIGLYMFRALLVHPQEALHIATGYITCVLYQLAATRIGVELVSETRNIPSATCGSPPEDEKVINAQNM